MGLQLVVYEVVFSLAFLPTDRAEVPLVLCCRQMHIEDMLSQVGSGAVLAWTVRADRTVRWGGGKAHPCNTQPPHQTLSTHIFCTTTMGDRWNLKGVTLLYLSYPRRLASLKLLLYWQLFLDSLTLREIILNPYPVLFK